VRPWWRTSLLLRIFLSTAVAMTVPFAAAGWLLLRQASDALSGGVEEEVRGSLASVEALWRASGDTMRTSSALLSTMSDVRAAFGTRDAMTIQDTAAEIWARGAASPETLLLVVEPDGGRVLAAVGDRSPGAKAAPEIPAEWIAVARKSFPKPAPGFAFWRDMLWQVVLTPVYVDGSSGGAPVLLNVLVAAQPIGSTTLTRMEHDTGGTGFILTGGNRTIAQTEGASDPAARFVSRQLELSGLDGAAIGHLVARRPLQLVENRIARLRWTIALGWIGAMLIGLLLSFWLTRRITRPIGELERAAREVGRENYSVRVDSATEDELGLLARTFNQMCVSIEGARSELIRKERIHAIGRLAASIAHDLRNPLSAVTGGAEMIAEMDLPPEQSRRAARTVHKAAQRMQHMLEELSLSVKKQSSVRTEEDLRELVDAAVQSQSEKFLAKGIAAQVEVPAGIVVTVERGRFERVIVNLLSNAAEAMNDGGAIAITAADGAATLDIRDNGPGIPPEIRETLFQPFVTQGKKNGLGLGLALSRQTMLDHGGDLEAVYRPDALGAWFRLHLPLKDRKTSEKSA